VQLMQSPCSLFCHGTNNKSINKSINQSINNT
jgi:hypothetical protein